MGNERGVVMKGFVQDIESLAVKNSEFRRVVCTENLNPDIVAMKPAKDWA
jgi:hypothetical protein